jgi:hypothetical protein
MKISKIYSNKIKCNSCGDIIESKTVHDFKWCSCGKVAVDGGKEYLRRLAMSWDEFTDLSEYDIEYDPDEYYKDDDEAE